MLNRFSALEALDPEDHSSLPVAYDCSLLDELRHCWDQSLAEGSFSQERKLAIVDRLR